MQKTLTRKTTCMSKTKKRKKQTIVKDQTPKQARSRYIIAILAIMLLGFIVYANSLDGEFLWDDQHLVKDNLYIRDWSNISKFFTESMATGADAPTMYSFYRPLQMITYTIDYTFWKSNVKGYHLSNIIFHILAALALFWFVNILYKNWLISLLTSILFVIHPIHTEAVSYISGRADPLVLSFMLLCFIFYIKALGREGYVFCVLSCLSYILAILAKEISLVLPLLFLLYHYTFKKKLRLKQFVPILSIGLLYIILRLSILSFLISHITRKTTLIQRLPGFFVAFSNYIRLLILPFNLHMEYGNKLFNLANHQAILGMIILLGVTLLLWKTKSERNIMFFSASWFLVCLLPSANLYPINAYMAEHWLYLPSIGFFLILSKAMASMYQKKQLKNLGLVITIALIVFYSYLTFNQNNYWRKTVPFYQRTLRYAPQSSRVYYNLGNEYRRIGDYEKAILAYNKATKINPRDADVYYNLGMTYSDLGENEKAIEQYKATIEINPSYDKAYYNIGNLYYQLGDVEQALEYYKKVIKINPLHVKAYNNLGVTYNRLGDKIRAEATFKKAIEIDPGKGISYCNLAIFYFGKGEYDKAVKNYKIAEEKGFVDLKFSQKLAPYM